VTGTRTGYARPRPALGFDPVPGDAGSTTVLARRYAEIATEIAAVQDQVTRIDLTRWEGRAADAARARQAALVRALAQAADTSTKLSGAAARWVPRLTTYQAEADALERRAAAEQANRQYLATRAPQVPQLTSDLADSATALAAIRAQAEQLHQEYLATATSILTQFDLKAWWEGTDPYRAIIEAILAPFDVTGTDHWVSVLRKIGLEPKKVVRPVDESLAEIRRLMFEGAPHDDVVTALMKGGDAAKTAGRRLDAFDAFNPAWVKTVEKSVSGIEWTGRVLGGVGLAADTSDLISPQDSGAVGWVDRGAAAVNGGFLTADLLGAEAVMDVIPGVGEVAITATGLYLAGDFLYHHWTPFHDVANDVGHAAVRTADDLGHAASSAWHSITSVGSWF
jgi:hypothetical protein